MSNATGNVGWPGSDGWEQGPPSTGPYPVLSVLISGLDREHRPAAVLDYVDKLKSHMKGCEVKNKQHCLDNDGRTVSRYGRDTLWRHQSHMTIRTSGIS